MSNSQDIDFEIKNVEKIQMRKIIFAFYEEKNKNISKRVNRKLQIRPEMNLSWKNKSVIFFVFQNILSESKYRPKTRLKLGFGPLKGQGCPRG